MGGMIPLGDASRGTRRWPVVTVGLIAANVWVFWQELEYGERFVYDVVGDTGADCGGARVGNARDGDVSACGLAAHYREHGVLLGVRAGD